MSDFSNNKNSNFPLLQLDSEKEIHCQEANFIELAKVPDFMLEKLSSIKLNQIEANKLKDREIENNLIKSKSETFNHQKKLIKNNNLLLQENANDTIFNSKKK